MQAVCGSGLKLWKAQVQAKQTFQVRKPVEPQPGSSFLSPNANRSIKSVLHTAQTVLCSMDRPDLGMTVVVLFYPVSGGFIPAL